MLETYYIKEEGYHPFLIREGWQVAQLNFTKEQHIDNIFRVEAHHKTDEVFVLLKGKAVLVLAKIKDGNPIFEVELMKPKITYNIPENAWHNIAMEKGSEVLIVEKSNTHLNDVSYFDLTQDKIKELKKMVKDIL
jgi:mannose-6-phosphate isomerase-like protein (cupin superfamily)